MPATTLTKATRRTPRTPTAEPALVIIAREGQVARVHYRGGKRPDLERDLLTILRTVGYEAVDDPEHGYCVERKARPLIYCVRFLDGIDLAFHVGLLPIVEEYLTQRGYQVIAHECCVPDLPAPCPLENFDSVVHDVDFVQHVQNHDRGLFLYQQDNVEPWWLVLQMARAWPKKSFAVIATRIEDADRVGGELKTYMRDVAVLSGEHCPERLGRVVVTTLDALVFPYKHDIGMRDRDICIALDPHELIPNKLDPINEALNARMYGLLPRAKQLTPFVWDNLAAFYGPDHLYIPRPGVLGSLPHVVTVPFKGGSSLKGHKTAFEVKKSGIWENKGRNRFLAHLARNLSRGQGAKVSPQLNGLHDVAQVGLLVENMSHALALARELPEASVLGAQEMALVGLSDADREILQRPGGNNHPICIMTFAALDENPQLDVVIRADAGSGIPKQLHHNDIFNVLVDVQDRHHPILRRWSRQRQSEYQNKAGFTVDAAATTPLQRWLQTRPQLENN